MTMTQAPETVTELEEMLRGNGVVLTPVEPPREDIADLTTPDGQFQIEPARVMNRQENAVTLYRTDTAEPIATDVNEALKRLKKRYPAVGDFARTYPQLSGRYTFTLGVKDANGRLVAPEPILPRPIGGELCWLHPDSDHFGYTRDIGVISVCRSKAMRTGLSTEQHIKAKHEGVWPLIERQKSDAKETASQERLERLFQVALGQAPNTPTQEAPTDAPTEEPQEEERVPYVSDKPPQEPAAEKHIRIPRPKAKPKPKPKGGK